VLCCHCSCKDCVNVFRAQKAESERCMETFRVYGAEQRQLARERGPSGQPIYVAALPSTTRNDEASDTDVDGVTATTCGMKRKEEEPVLDRRPNIFTRTTPDCSLGDGTPDCSKEDNSRAFWMNMYDSRQFAIGCSQVGMRRFCISSMIHFVTRQCSYVQPRGNVIIL
jgi:hypothetical protein